MWDYFHVIEARIIHMMSCGCFLKKKFFIYMRSFRAQPDKQMLHVSHMLFQNLQSDQVYVIFPQEQSQEESCVKEIWAGDFINDHQEGA